jgi:hypothetical protein
MRQPPRECTEPQNALEWIFIGYSDDIHDSLLNHLRDFDTSLVKRPPTGFVDEVCATSRRAARHDRLVHEI